MKHRCTKASYPSPIPNLSLSINIGLKTAAMTICLPLDPKMLGQSRWRSCCQLKQTWSNYFLVLLWKSVEKRRHFDRWNSSSCQLRLQQKAKWIQFLVKQSQCSSFFWLNRNFRVKQATFVVRNEEPGCSYSSLKMKTNTPSSGLHPLSVVWEWGLPAGLLPQSASSSSHRKSGAIDYSVNADRSISLPDLNSVKWMCVQWKQKRWNGKGLRSDQADQDFRNNIQKRGSWK